MAKRQNEIPRRNSPARWCWSAPARWAAPCCDGWLARGLPIRRSHRARAAAGEGDQGAGQARRAHQSERRRRHDVAAMVIAVKPQSAPRRAAAARRADRCNRPSWSRSWPARTLGFLEQHLPNAAIVRAMPNTPAAIGRGITVAVGNAPRHSRAARKLAHAPARRDRRGRMGRRRSADGRGDRRVRLRPGLCFPARRSDGAGRRCRRSAGRACREARARDRRRFRRTAASLAARSPPPCGRTSPRPAAPPPRRWRC